MERQNCSHFGTETDEMDVKMNYITKNVILIFIASLFKCFKKEFQLTAAPIDRFKMDIRDTRTPPTTAHAPPHNSPKSFISPIVITYYCQVF